MVGKTNLIPRTLQTFFCYLQFYIYHIFLSFYFLEKIILKYYKC